MPSLLSRHQHDAAAASSALTIPLVLLAASVLANIGTSTKHALLTSATAWLSLCIYTTSKVGARSLLDGAPSQRLAWAAGGMFALAQVCERAVDGKGIWWAKALLPLLIHLFTKSGVFEPSDTQLETPASPVKDRHASSTYGSKSTLALLTVSGLVAVYAHLGSISAVALGLSHAVLQVLALDLVERAKGAAKHHTSNGGSVIYSASGLLTQSTKAPASNQEQWLALVRDVSTAGGLAAAVAALTLESFRFGGLAYYGLLGQAMGNHWVFGQGVLSLVYAVGTIAVHMAMYGALLLAVQRHGALSTSLVPLAAALVSQLLLDFSFSSLWFAVLCACSALSFLDEQDTFIPRSRMKLRAGSILTATGLVSFAILTIYYLQHSSRAAALNPFVPHPPGLDAVALGRTLEPLNVSSRKVHPIKTLVQDAQASWNVKLQSQSHTLEAAVTEYKRRYGMPPPPHFDKWYEFAKRKGVQLIDEYDTIYHSLLPFWGLSPSTIRARAQEALGFGDNQLMGLLIRNGKAAHVEGGQEWLQQAAVGMMESFIDYLPDMDLAFNVHDEPRVVVPHDELSRLIEVALQKNIPAASGQKTPKNAFSPRPEDINSGKRVLEVKTTRFNVFAHQPTWIPSRLSCSPQSPARAIEESMALDKLSAYALSELGFVYNHTAFSDVCNSPSFSKSHGFFDRPNAFNVVHDLFPVFSQSKMSSFQDILYPSPWYWYGKVEYKEGKDMDWEKKQNRLWWRGSTTGGFSRAGGWKRQHRQQFVRKVNALDAAKVLKHSNAGATDENPDEAKWVVQEVPRQDYKDIMDVHFSHVGQCDPGDCDAQREFFNIVEPADQQEAWKFKYLLDMDGNAFSGRFYAFLMSHSLTFKMSVFREWHEEWIRPWVHYIPLSLRADEVLESVRYFDGEEEGRPLATSIAEEGRDWAFKALRNEDLEVWLFRLLLEYGRVIDDNRALIGYSGS
ncbi:glycosyltransferase family 90 [Lecanosticta acicola]|uniref:Glycosyltransferase family 90 n=1 Tax=Lecanosticta acicola TaxID=111012 RepID=A0AAI8Z4Q1_9PEZI|nr:glycosyltransferase family 90 [Lecanosticta acicola]